MTPGKPAYAYTAGLTASLAAGVSGFLWLRLQGRTPHKRAQEDIRDTD